MENNKKIAAVYSEHVLALDLEELDEKAATKAANSLKIFGLECNEFIVRKLKSSDIEELRKLLKIIRSLDLPEIDEGLTEVVVERIVPLDLKIEFFQVMTENGISIDTSFLQHLQEAEELYHQVNYLLNSEDVGSDDRSLALIEDFLKLPRTLKLSLIQELTDESGANAFTFIKPLIGKDREITTELIEIALKFPNKDAISALQKLVNTSVDKEIVKKAKRAIYILKEKGVEVEAQPQPQEDVVYREDSDDGEIAYITTFDSFGARLLILVTPALSRVLVSRASIDEKNGMLRFAAAEMARKNLRDMLKELKDHVAGQETSSIIKIDADHAKWLLQQAYDLAVKRDQLIPESYKAIRYRIKTPENYDPLERLKSLVKWDKNDLGWIKNYGDELFDIPEVSIWMVEKEQLLAYTQKYIAAADTKIVLNEDQQRERLNKIISEYSCEYITEERLAQLRERARETAYMQFKKGNRDNAKKLGALFETLENAEIGQSNRFLDTLMLRSIVGTIQAFAQEEQRMQRQQQQENQSGGIIKP